MGEGKRFLHLQDKPVLVLRSPKSKRKLEPSTTLSWDLMEEFNRGDPSNNNLGGHSHRLHSPSASPTSRDQPLLPVDLLLRFSRTDSSLPATPSRPASSSHPDNNLPDSSHPDSNLLDSNLLLGSQVNPSHHLFSTRSGIPSTLTITVVEDHSNQVPPVQLPFLYRISLLIVLVLP